MVRRKDGNVCVFMCASLYLYGMEDSLQYSEPLFGQVFKQLSLELIALTIETVLLSLRCAEYRITYQYIRTHASCTGP